MKILRIELENLNSLRGKWTINLSDEIYESNGIFAVTGPTGAGKTTIFDAVCLALYGQTPRLGKIGRQQNEIMSRRTKECYARVLFEVNGEKYLTQWEQHYSGRNLQSPKHIISDADTGEIISETVTGTQAKIQELTGLDFKRFKQAVMLEQGGFDAFLKANKNDRAEILELLTGTEIYSEISKLVYERAKDEKIKLDDIKFQRDNRTPNDDFQSEDEISDALQEAEKNLESAAAKQKENNLSLEWLKNIQKLEKNLAENSREISQLERRFEVFTADYKRLETGQRAAELAGDFSNLKANRENYKKLQDNARKLKDEISNEEAIISDIEKERLPKINKEISEMKKNFSPEESPESFCGFAKERVRIFTEIATRENDIKNKKAAYEKNFQIAQRNLKASEENRNKFQAIYNEKEQKVFELSNVRVEGILEIERRKLKPGRPCPICGSTEHPGLIIHNEKINDVDDALNLAKIQFEKARKDLDKADENFSISQANDSTARANLDNATQEFNKISDQRTEAKSEISDLLDKLGIKIKNVGEIIPAIDAWLAKLKNLEESLRRLNEKRNDCKIRVDTKQNSLSQANSELEISKNELENLEKDFSEKLREKNFEDEKNFTASIIDADEIRRLTDRKQELENEKIRLGGLKDNFERNLAAEKEKSITKKNLEELEPEVKAVEKFINDLNKKITLLEKSLEDRKKLQRELAKLTKDYERQEEIYARWSALSNLIGSAQGDKFRVFAQNITLSMMINLANEQLEKMNGRYILTASPDSNELDLSVVDKEQAGEIRPTENLSGGERFIISLALALGLSQISGNKSRIDSLFLDEGFGSLDEDALNTALEALGELRRGGRMIGIISHVAALRERIAAQIEVIHKSEGVSIIQGPGIKRN